MELKEEVKTKKRYLLVFEIYMSQTQKSDTIDSYYAIVCFKLRNNLFVYKNKFCVVPIKNCVVIKKNFTIFHINLNIY